MQGLSEELRKQWCDLIDNPEGPRQGLKLDTSPLGRIVGEGIVKGLRHCIPMTHVDGVD